MGKVTMPVSTAVHRCEADHSYAATAAAAASSLDRSEHSLSARPQPPPPPSSSSSSSSAAAGSDHGSAGAKGSSWAAEESPPWIPDSLSVAAWVLLTPLVALYGLATHPLQPYTAIAAFVFYYVGGLGITVGYHRHFSHRAFAAGTGTRLLLAAMGTSAPQGSILNWVRDHRVHHGHCDTPRDPYTIQHGFFYAHMGWMLRRRNEACARAVAHVDVRDLEAVWWIRLQHRTFGVWALLLAVALPTAVCGLGWGDWWGGFYFAGVGKAVVLQHATSLINSAAHFWGNEDYASHDKTPRNSQIIALFTFGEGEHNAHHAFPSDYRNGLKWYHYDPSKWMIALLERLGLAHSLRRYDDAAVAKAAYKRRAELLEQERAQLPHAPVARELPALSRGEVRERRLLVVDGIAHDVEDFADEHPGGAAAVRRFMSVGDASRAFRGANGGGHEHTPAAWDMLRMKAVGRVSVGGADL